jgi:hypothetical protein
LAIAIALAACAAMILLGLMLRLIARADPSGTEQWRRVAPFVYLGTGLVLMVAGWFSHVGIASVAEMIAGAIMAGNGAFLVVGNHVKRPKPTLAHDD